ncbi:hypothetical protein DWB84_01820 [Saccharophagus sp. K07]|jgi:hypothetical protein|uniref:hypothetical protein n=1 Tax=Saccharophagus sp. K07 TaxID=2283636 RepID=UPI001651E643|nr:hypothetical protein [Saccharophagus sp. K07]MBC6904210.1 hypothetical protein [Saccharophagus sp. K07]
MRLFIALRLFNESHAKAGIESPLKGKPRGKLIDLNITRFHPALRNINEYLRDHGFLPETRQGFVLYKDGGKKTEETQENCRLYWCEIETDLSIDYWQSVQEVEAIIPREEFNKFVLSIRYKSGAAYISACEEYAKSVWVHTPQILRYQPPVSRKYRAA